MSRRMSPEERGERKANAQAFNARAQQLALERAIKHPQLPPPQEAEIPQHGKRGRGRVPEFGKMTLEPVMRSRLLQHVLAAHIRATDRADVFRDIAPLLDNRTEIDPDGPPVVVLDASVVFSGLNPGTKRKSCYQLVHNAIEGKLQGCATPMIAGSIIETITRLAESGSGPGGVVMTPDDEQALCDYLRAVINVAGPTEIPEEISLPPDDEDIPYVLAALRALSFVPEQKVLLVSRDSHLLNIRSSGLPANLRILHPGVASVVLS